MDIMIDSIPSEITKQETQACAVIEGHLLSTLLANHLFGSAVVGGLKPSSDIDLLVTVGAPPAEATRQALLLDLLTVSAPPGQDKALQALEVTVIAHDEVVRWHYPSRREAQFGEWLRKDFLAGIFAPAVEDFESAYLVQRCDGRDCPKRCCCRLGVGTLAC
jgi:predicted nucleotidyltransferase